MHDMTSLKEMLEKELGILAMDDKISMQSLQKIHMLTDTIKNIDKISALEEGEYSQRGGYSRNSYDGGSYGDMSYDGNSYARRKRDSMGRYSRDEYVRENRSNRVNSRGYSRDDGKEEMIEHLEDMMNKATSEKERQAFQRCITAIENG